MRALLGDCFLRYCELTNRRSQPVDDSAIISPMFGPANTPSMVIRAAIDTFIFNVFLADAISEGRINPSFFRDQAKVDLGQHVLVFKRSFSSGELQSFGQNNVLMALGTAAIATDTAMDAVFSKENKPHDTSELGSARAIIFQIRCAFAHDPLSPVWKPDVDRYKYNYRITVQLPLESGELQPTVIDFHPPSLKGKHLSALDFGGVGAYIALLYFCLETVEAHHLGNQKYVLPVEP